MNNIECAMLPVAWARHLTAMPLTPFLPYPTQKRDEVRILYVTPTIAYWYPSCGTLSLTAFHNKHDPGCFWLGGLVNALIVTAITLVLNPIAFSTAR